MATDIDFFLGKLYMRCSGTRDFGQDDPVAVGTPQGSVSAGTAGILSNMANS